MPRTNTPPDDNYSARYDFDPNARELTRMSSIYTGGIVEWIEYDRKNSNQWHRYTQAPSIKQIDKQWKKLEPSLRLIGSNTYHTYDIKYHPAATIRQINRRVATSKKSGIFDEHRWTTRITPKRLEQLTELSYEQLFDNVANLRWLEKVRKRRPKPDMLAAEREGRVQR